jgi:hypothetical protein
MNDSSIKKMTVEASILGLKPGEWPETVQFDSATWTKGQTVTAASGEVQYVDYTDGERWIVVYRD